MSYWTESQAYWDQVKANVIQSTIQNFSAARYGRLVVQVPPLEEQQAIAAWLDERTARIDTLIAKKQRLIELLQEKRQAIISKAVTRGLDPHVKLKDSGIPWLGEVPEHWEVKRVKHLTKRITKGTTPTTLGHDYTPSGILFVKVESITSTHQVDLNQCAFIDSQTHALLERSQLKEGDILLSIAGAIGRSAIVSRELLPANTNQAVAIISPT
ncbi:MAG: restriction endonuclease subunit S, partial [Nitrospira sp.]|nr:restriction endonuclease subunit S [Nitrospira sp.]